MLERGGNVSKIPTSGFPSLPQWGLGNDGILYRKVKMPLVNFARAIVAIRENGLCASNVDTLAMAALIAAISRKHSEVKMGAYLQLD